LQVIPHMPAVHVGFVSGAEAQPRMQPPQWLGLVLVLTHIPLHSVSPMAQPEAQRPPEHKGVEPEHIVVHEPHALGVSMRSSHPLDASRSQSPNSPRTRASTRP
jgi:hypothetical protein